MDTGTAAFLFKSQMGSAFNQWNADQPIRTGFPHASAMLAPVYSYCERALVLLSRYPSEVVLPPIKPWDTDRYAIFKHGWMIHEKYQELLSKYYDVIEVETPHFDAHYLLHYTPDAIVNHCGEKMIVEIKGYNNEHFEKLNEQGEPPSDAYRQADLYMHLLGLRHAIILVENKDNQKTKVWCAEYQEDAIQSILFRMSSFQQAYQSELLPKRRCDSEKDRLAEKCIMCKRCFHGSTDHYPNALSSIGTD